MLRADVVVAELQRLAQRQLENLLRPGREGDVTGRRRAALADDLLDLVADGFERDARRLEGFGGDAFALVDEAQQDVLGTDVAVVEQPRFLLGEYHDPAGPVGEAFEHVSPFDERRIRVVTLSAAFLRRPDSCIESVATRSSGLTRSGSRPAEGPHGSACSACPTAPTSPLLALAGMDADRPADRGRNARRPSSPPTPTSPRSPAHLIVAGGKRLRPALAVRRPRRLDGRPRQLTRRAGRRRRASWSTSARCTTTT